MFVLILTRIHSICYFSSWSQVLKDNYIDLGHEDRVCSYLPLSHIAAQVIDLHVPMALGACTYFCQPDALKGSLTVTMKDVRYPKSEENRSLLYRLSTVTHYSARKHSLIRATRGPFLRSGGANLAFRLRHQKRSAEPQWWFIVITLLSMPLVICSNMIWHYLKSNLNFNEQNLLRTFFDTNIDFITKAIDVGYCNFYHTSSYRIVRYGTYSYSCGQ
jgi:acyl-CoA synthetase (AMP-forming)/AMP-acid ligase II